MKRLVGLPGDTVEFRRGALYLNGERVKTEAMATPFDGADGVRYRVLREHLGECADEPSSCGQGDGNCLFSWIGDGVDCCTAGNMNNMCLQ